MSFGMTLFFGICLVTIVCSTEYGSSTSGQNGVRPTNRKTEHHAPRRGQQAAPFPYSKPISPRRAGRGAGAQGSVKSFAQIGLQTLA